MEDIEDKIRLAYLDEEEGWNSIVNSKLKDIFHLFIPEKLPKKVEQLWELLYDFGPQAILVDYRLNESGELSYDGDKVIKEIHKHNKHLPMFIFTSYEENAIMECKNAQIIRGKEMISDSKDFPLLLNIIRAGVNNYDNRKLEAETIIKSLQNKISKGEDLTNEEMSNKFDAELYLSELDLDSSVRADMITNKSNRALDEMLEIARKIAKIHK